MQCIVTYGSTYVLVALSIDRYDAITHPMNFTGSCKYIIERPQVWIRIVRKGLYRKGIVLQYMYINNAALVQ